MEIIFKTILWLLLLLVLITVVFIYIPYGSYYISGYSYGVPKNDDEFKDVLKCQAMRVTTFRKMCNNLGFLRNLNDLSEEELKYLMFKYIVFDERKLILKAIPKAGCTSWKTLFFKSVLETKNISKNVQPHRWGDINKFIGTLPYFTKDEILKKLNNYLVILTIRHPFLRLESGFKNKWENRGAQKNINDTQKKLEEFLTMILTPPPGLFRTNNVHIHWLNYTELAHPCLIPNLYIAKLETITEDINYIIREKLNDNLDPVHLNPSRVINGSVTTNEGYPLPLFNSVTKLDERLKQLTEINAYGADMKLFGYNYKFVNGEVVAVCENMYKGMCC